MKIFVLLSIILFCMSILNPIHFNPWSSFISESICFIAFLLLLLFSPIDRIPKKTLIILLISLIPLVQYYLGVIYYFSISFLSFIYILCFWLAVVIGYNLSIKNKSLLFYFAYTYIFLCIFSSIIAIIQWLNIPYNTLYISGMVGNRPFANLAQPNHLATLLSMGLMSCFYLYEKSDNKNFLVCACFLFLFVIALTQSRTSWVFSLILLAYIYFNSQRFKLSIKYLLIWLGVYVGFILLIPVFGDFLSNNFNFNINQTTNFIERASTGYLRFEIWNQSVYALFEKPWFGYGWNQTSVGQYAIIESSSGKEWFSSAHNIFLDILLWNGIFLGIFIIVYFSLTYIICLFKNKTTDAIFACLILLPLLIHFLLEFPYKYAYFLLPAGILWGVMISEKSWGIIKIKAIYLKIIAVWGFLLLSYLFKEFNQNIDNIVAANTHEMNEKTNHFELAYPVYILDEFKCRAQWFAVYPYTKLNQLQLKDYEKIVSLHITPYDLVKYAQLLAYNGKEIEARRQLKILKKIYGIDYSYAEILRKGNIK